MEKDMTVVLRKYAHDFGRLKQVKYRAVIKDAIYINSATSINNCDIFVELIWVSSNISEDNKSLPLGLELSILKN